MPADREFTAVALVTGVNRGIGFEATRQFAQGGLVVLLGSRDRDKGNAAAGDIEPIRLDVTSIGDIDDARRFVEEQFGRLDVLTTRAGSTKSTRRRRRWTSMRCGRRWSSISSAPGR
jgi:NAD(P)-dependent dehydrogenase (short-subunit alcohol dehydrogenase family)